MACEIVPGQANQLSCPVKRNKHFKHGSKKELADKTPPATLGAKTSKAFCERNLVQTTLWEALIFCCTD